MGAIALPRPPGPRHAAGTRSAFAVLDARRVLQLALAAVWLLDGLLQFQSVMFNKSFGQSLAATAPGNPWIIARPIVWDATLVEHHAVLLNTAFATIQLLLGLGIAFRPTVRVALAASIAWSLGVWWFGEGLGGVLFGAANPLTGAPGAVIIYALLAVVLWPAARGSGSATFIAGGGAIGARAARTLWSVLWFSFAYFALLPANRAPQALSETVTGMVSGEPSWLAAIERNSASLVAHQGLAASVAFAIAYVVIGVCVWLPPRYAKPALVLSLVVAAVIWVVGEAFGMILAGGATDPNSGPLLAILALAYWPARTPAEAPPPVLADQRVVFEGSDA
jgi:hypothetical protein